jgi:hypothetical protein
MDEHSTTYTTIATWAEAAPMGINTLQRQRTLALKTGWLFAEPRHEGKGHKSPLLRCTVPDDIKLSDIDEKLADALIRKFRDIELGDIAKNDAAISDLGDIANDVPISALGDIANVETSVSAVTGDIASDVSVTLDDAVSDASKNGPMLYPKTPLAVSLDVEDPVCCIHAVSAESSNPLAALETQPEVLEGLRRREVMKSKRKTEGRAASDASAVSGDDAVDDAGDQPNTSTSSTMSASQRNVVTDYMRRMPGLQDIHVAARFQLPTEQVRQLRELMGLSTTT